MIKSNLYINNSFSDNESGSPMDGVQNMSDAMLVLAVGIMLALVINWKIDIKDVAKGQEEKIELDGKEMQELNADSTKENNSVSVEDVENKYEKTGTVYIDKETGKSYIVFD